MRNPIDPKTAAAIVASAATDAASTVASAATDAAATVASAATDASETISSAASDASHVVSKTADTAARQVAAEKVQTDSRVRRSRWFLALGLAIFAGFNIHGIVRQSNQNAALCVATNQRAKVDYAYHTRLNRDLLRLQLTGANAIIINDMAKAEDERAKVSPLLTKAYNWCHR